MSTKTRRTDWVVIDFSEAPVVQRCRRCGDTAPMPTGLIDYCTDVMKAFLKAHRKCVEIKKQS